jgi:hypothetical protein
VIRPFDPVHAAVAYNVVAVSDGADLVDAWLEVHEIGALYAPARSVVVVEVEHDAVTSPAWAVEHQPLLVVGGADADCMAWSKGLGNVRD